MPGILRLKTGNILFAKLNEAMGKYEAFANKQSASRLAMDATIKSSDVYSHLLTANQKCIEKGERALFTPADLVGESSLLITGGKLFFTSFSLSVKLTRAPLAIDRLRYNRDRHFHHLILPPTQPRYV